MKKSYCRRYKSPCHRIKRYHVSKQKKNIILPVLNSHKKSNYEIQNDVQYIQKNNMMYSINGNFHYFFHIFVFSDTNGNDSRTLNLIPVACESPTAATCFVSKTDGN